MEMVHSTGANFDFPKVPDFALTKKNAPEDKAQAPVDRADLGSAEAPKADGSDSVKTRASAHIDNAPDSEFFTRKTPNRTTKAVPTSLSMEEAQPTAPANNGPAVKHEIVADFEARTKEALGPLAHAQNMWDISEIKGEIPTLAQLQETFNECANDKDIPWEHIIDGCYARAHLAADKFLDKGYNASKFYGIIDDNHPGWRFHIENKFCVGDWWYHVSCLVFAKDDKGKVDGYVVDPAVNPKSPIKAADWIKSYWNEKFPIKFDTTHADIYEPQEEVPSPHEPSSFSQEKFDSMIEESKKIDAEYSVALHDIKDKYYKEHPNEKPDGWQ